MGDRSRRCRADLRGARGTAFAPLLTRKLRKKLKPVFETQVDRVIYPLGHKPSAIELAVDRGSIETGAASASLCELELELKRGDEAELFALARKLTHALPAQLAFKSKSERGYELVNGMHAAPVKHVGCGACRRDQHPPGVSGRRPRLPETDRRQHAAAAQG